MSDIPALTHDTGFGIFRVSEDGLDVEGCPPPELWVAYGGGLKRVGETWGKAWGDFLNAFEDAFPELDWRQFVDDDDLKNNTSSNYKRAMRVFPKDRRRTEGGKVKLTHLVRLSWNTITDEEREMYLDRVEAEDLTCNELYQLMSPKPQAIELEGHIRWRGDCALYLLDVGNVDIPDGKYKVRLERIEEE